MTYQENILSFLDLLDLDEELIDSRLKSIMVRKQFTNKHLVSAIQLLQYKQLVNMQENSECENEEEYEFAAKLIKDVDSSNIDNVCKIVSIALSLNTSTLVSKSEHFMQQILGELPIQVNSVEISDDSRAILILKVADSILNAVLKHKKRLYLPFLELPVESILTSLNEKLKSHFLNSTVHTMFTAVTGFNILDSIWNYIKQLQGEDRSISLKVLSSLSDYFLPALDNEGIFLIESNVVHQSQFWEIILYGLLSTDLSLRKISVYLAKRAIDYVNTQKTDVIVQSEGNIIFQWLHMKSNSLKLMWDNYFVLIDSLEEKQSNIVLPSLKIFPSLKDMGLWLNCAFNIGLKHDNTQVRLKCIQYRLEINLNSKSEAITLLEALNDINIYDNNHEIELLKTKFESFIKDKTVFMLIFNSIPTIQWSPVPFYHISSILASIDLENSIKLTGQQTTTAINNILKIPCNNVLLREAAHINIAHFTAHCCTGLHWRDLANIYSYLPLNYQLNNCLDNPFVSLNKDMVKKEDKETFCEFLLQSHLNINFGLHYFQHNKEDLSIYIKILCEKIKKIDDISSRQYSDKRECLQDCIYLTQLNSKLNAIEYAVLDDLHVVVLAKYKTVLLYISNLLLSNTILSLEEIILISDGLSIISNAINFDQLKEDLLQLYKTSVLFFKDKSVALENIVLCLHIMHSLTNSKILLSNYQHEMLDLQDLLTSTKNFKNKQSIGKLRNAFYEKSCEIVYAMLVKQEFDIERYTEDLVEYIEVVLDCGGYGCLRFCLKIMNSILSLVIANKNVNINMAQIIFRMWKEIEELKSNNQYTPCIEEFVNLITHEQFLRVPDYNNIVILYCKKLIDFGDVKLTPLYFLINKLDSLVITKDYGHIIYILSEVLLYSPVPRKDQRITDNLILEVIQEPKYGFNREKLDTHFNFEVQYLSVLALSKIKDLEILDTIEKFIRNKIDDVFKNKTRYHGHSRAHRLLLAGVQHLLLISLKKVDHINTSMETLNWCIELLGKLPHQISVKISLEWYIALHLDIMEIGMDNDLLRNLYDVPLTSQLLVLYWTVKPLITRKKDSKSREFEFVLDFLIRHTMGPTFNARLHAQYLAAKLYAISNIFAPKYPFVMTILKMTLRESEDEKNHMKMKNDYFVNDFDIIQDLTPCFLYYFLPRYCDTDNNESVDISYVRNILKEINSNLSENLPSSSFHKEWISSHKTDDEVFSLKINKNDNSKTLEEEDVSGTIQKKYVPWRNMTDVFAYEMEKKVALIIGVNGACRGNELLNVTTNDVQKHSDQLLLVTLSNTKAKRSFVIRNEQVAIVEKYLALRPALLQTKRIFMHYLNGKCTRQVIGKNKIGTMPREIANYLKLPNPELYTGHCFRRTAAALVLETADRVIQSMEHDGTMQDVSQLIEDASQYDLNMASSVEVKIEPFNSPTDPWLEQDEVTLNITSNLREITPLITESNDGLHHEVVIKQERDTENIADAEENNIDLPLPVYNIKKENKSELIVVASLIDKLPNLGGMARTSEVFGVKTYVVDSLRHLQDKQFQSLSVSAESWIDVEEVRPGPSLKHYLMTKKSEGYSVVAAEQTSNSVKLQDFQFPMKTLLLLGHEKEGIPCDLLPMMDYCVEIPQQGFVRSLNVHVTAAIFVWEYARQNIL